MVRSDFGLENTKTHKNTCVLLHGPLADSRNTQKHVLFYTWAKTHKNTCFLLFSHFGTPGKPKRPQSAQRDSGGTHQDPQGQPMGSPRSPPRSANGPKATQEIPEVPPRDPKDSPLQEAQFEHFGSLGPDIAKTGSRRLNLSILGAWAQIWLKQAPRGSI